MDDASMSTAEGAAVRHPAVLAHERERARDPQLRVADAITAFAGSMAFVYLHVAAFALWCVTGLAGLDPYPFNFLTLVVSLEAIFLSAFVLIGQNRQAAFSQRKADHDFDAQQADLCRNTELTQVIERIARDIATKLDASLPPASDKM